MKNYARHAVSGFLIIFSMTILGACCGYLFRLLLARHLSVSEYGLFYSVYALLTVIFLFRDLGTTNALAKYIPEFQVNGEPERLKSGIVVAARTTLIVSAILSVIVLLSADFIAASYLKAPAAASFVRLMALVFFAFSCDVLIVNCLMGFQRHWLYASFQLVRQAIPVVIVAALFLFGTDILRVPYALFGTSVLLLVAFLAVLGTTLLPGFWRMRRSGEEGKLQVMLMRFGMATTVIGVGSLIAQYTDTILLTSFLGTAASGIYNAALPISSVFIYVGTALDSVILPLTSELRAKNLDKRIGEAISFFYRYAALLLLPLSLVVLVYANLIIVTLFGPAYAAATHALQILVCGSAFYIIAQTNFSVLSGIGKPGMVAELFVGGAVLNVVLNLLFIPRFEITGAALATALTYLCMAIASVIALGRHVQVELPYRHWLVTAGLSALFLGLVTLLKGAIHANVYVEAACVVLIAGTAYLGLAVLTKHIDVKEIKGKILAYRKH